MSRNSRFDVEIVMGCPFSIEDRNGQLIPVHGNKIVIPFDTREAAVDAISNIVISLADRGAGVVAGEVIRDTDQQQRNRTVRPVPPPLVPRVLPGDGTG